MNERRAPSAIGCQVALIDDRRDGAPMRRLLGAPADVLVRADQIPEAMLDECALSLASRSDVERRARQRLANVRRRDGSLLETIVHRLPVEIEQWLDEVDTDPTQIVVI